MVTKNLLVELLVEELPPKSLQKLGEAFADGVRSGLADRQFLSQGCSVTRFASPRRLAVHITEVLAVAPDSEHIQKLMPVSVALAADGTPTPALKKRAEKMGQGALLERWPDSEDGRDRMYVANDGKTDAVYFRTLAAGQPLAQGLLSALEDTLASLPIAKHMTYQLADGWSTETFVRPLHGVLALHGTDVVPLHLRGLDSGRCTHGHRFEAVTPVLSIDHADQYADRLRTEGAVIASFAERRGEIERQLDAAARKERLTPVDDAALLDEVTALVERPNVLLCRFDEEFLGVPPECLILTMKANQKYFPLLDAQARLTNKFLVVSNIRPDDPSRVIEGNERVVRPRLADAKFFFDQDRKKTLESRVAGLAKVVYHNKLGSQGERVERVRAIARAIGDRLGGPALAQRADRAALLAKADLLTDMVGEFPELQGVMGGYYARHDGETEDVAFAVEDHYKPRFAGDTLPRNDVGIAVALGDKLETLVGLFGIGQLPTGDKDPFGLRRHALGVIRMLMERNLPLGVAALVQLGEAAFPPSLDSQRVRVDLPAFINDRLSGLLREQGHAARDIDAVLSLQPPILADVPRRLAAVRGFAALPEAAALAAANKRVGNILKKSAEAPPASVQTGLLKEPAEAALYDALQRIAPASRLHFEAGNHAASLQALAALKAPVDAFFDTVMVNAEDAALRANRLGLLAQLHAAMNQVADLSLLAS
jgi:glycyl-tRNA synthetase beta chain